MASKRHVRRKACTNKQRHKDLAAANRHLASLYRAGRMDGQMVSYHCKFCGGYHVGHLNIER